MSDLRKFEIPGHVTVEDGGGGLPKLVIRTEKSSAEIYLHGAHVSGFQKIGEEPILFMSEENHFLHGSAIRGGIPVIFPWFGARDGLPAHGFARITDWSVIESSLLKDGAVHLGFALAAGEQFQVEYHVNISETLTTELWVTNTGDAGVEFETCLHCYFRIGSIHTVRVKGLEGMEYFNQLTQAECRETEDQIHITEEVDRIFCDAASTVILEDPTLGRRITVEKSGSSSTILWNPWIEKSKRMSDFGDEEYLGMVCVEPGNVRKNKILLLPGQRAVLKVILSSEPMA